MFAKQLLLAVVVVTPALAEDGDGAPGNTAPQEPVRRARTGTFSVGAGYNTDDSFTLGAGITQSDLFGTGKLLSLDAAISGREQKFSARYSDPELWGTDYQLDARLIADDKQLYQFTRRSVGVDLELSHLIAPNLKWYAGYRLEHVKDVMDNPNLAGDEHDVGAIRIGLERNTLDQPFMATRGTKIGTMMEYASRDLGGSFEMLHLKSYGETHQPMGRAILHLSGSMETVTGDGIPIGEQLFFDGSSQIRGYRPAHVGPIDLAGRGTGSNLAMFARAELEVPVIRSIGLSVSGFADGGGMFGAHAGELAASTGFGLIWRSPIGPIGAYWAWTGSGGPNFVFGIGTTF